MIWIGMVVVIIILRIGRRCYGGGTGKGEGITCSGRFGYLLIVLLIFFGQWDLKYFIKGINP